MNSPSTPLPEAEVSPHEPVSPLNAVEMAVFLVDVLANSLWESIVERELVQVIW